MALLTRNINQPDENNIIICNDNDVCLFCATEYVKMNRSDLKSANKALRGKLTGEKAIAIPIPAVRGIVCREHIEKLYAVVNEHC